MKTNRNINQTTQVDCAVADLQQQLLEIHERLIVNKVNTLFGFLLVAEWLAAIVTAWVWSPLAWAGETSAVHIHMKVALLLGAVIISLPIYMIWFHRNATVTRHIIATAQMLMTALLIHLCGGRIETHFLVFGSLAFLAFYRDWPVLATASIVIIGEHIVIGFFYPHSVYGVIIPEPYRWLEHTLLVCFNDIFFMSWCAMSKKEMNDIAHKRAQLEITNKTIEEQIIKRTEEARANEQRFRTLCLSAPVTIFETDRSGAWNFIGTRWTELTKTNISAAVGDGWQKFIHCDDKERVMERWLQACTKQIMWKDEFRIVLPDRSIRWIRGSAVWCGQSEEEAVLIGSLEDITERRLIEESANRLRLMEQREDFMAALSHDLKNPVLGANRVLDLFLDGTLGQLSQDQCQLLGKIKQSNVAMIGMIQNLITSYQIDKGPYDSEFEDVDMVAVIDCSLREYQETLTEKKLSLYFDHCSYSQAVVHGNMDSLSRMVRNLLDNAVKFTPDGGTITARTRIGNGQIVIEIINTGSNISPSSSEKLFHRFWQGVEGKQYVSGTGLGLYICKQIVDMHNGSISCHSSCEEGTTFKVVLPAVPPRHEPQLATFDGPAVGDLESQAQSRNSYRRRQAELLPFITSSSHHRMLGY